MRLYNFILFGIWCVITGILYISVIGAILMSHYGVMEYWSGIGDEILNDD